jgi:Ca2+-binding RTX toxin-like protein
MASITAEGRSELIALYVTMFGAAPSVDNLSAMVTQREGGATLVAVANTLAAKPAFAVAYPGFLTADEFADRLVTNMLGSEVSTATRTWAVDWVKSQLSAGRGATTIVTEAVQALRSTTNTEFANAKALLANKVEVASYHSITKLATADSSAALSGITSAAATVTAAKASVDTATAPAGQTFILTNTVDSGRAYTGDAGDDRFISVDNTDPFVGTLTGGDDLIGGAGTDTLVVVASGTPVAPLIRTSGIEVLDLLNYSSAIYIINATLMIGLETVNVIGGNNTTIVQNPLSNLNIVASNSNNSIVTTSTLGSVGTADAISITLTAVGTTANTSITSNGIETFNVSLIGADSGSTTIGSARTVTLVSDELEKVNIAGSTAANLVVDLDGADLPGQVGTVNAGAATGNITIQVLPGDSLDKKTVITMGSGNDKVDIHVLDKDYTITGGTGTDTLVATAGATTALATADYVGVGVSGFEIIQASAAGTVDFRSLPNNTTFVATTGAGTYTAAGAGIKDSYLTATTGTLTLTRAINTANDALNVHLSAATAATVTLSLINEETIFLSSVGAGSSSTHDVSLIVADLIILVVTGSNSLNVTSLIGEANLAIVDASAHSGPSFTINTSNSIRAMTVNGSVGKPATLGGAVNIITTGSGADIVTGGAFRDVITTGLGNDSVDGGAGNDSISGGEGNDTLIGGSDDDTIVAAGTDLIDGGDGNDVVQVGAALGRSSMDLATIALGAGVNRVNFTATATTANATITATGGVYDILIDSGFTATMTPTQFSGAFLVNGVAGGGAENITFSTNGTINASAATNITGITLSAGTAGTGSNTLTIGTGTTSVVGAAGNDTIDAASGAVAEALLEGTITGNAGTADTVNVTGNTANTNGANDIVIAATVTGVEVINFSQTTANIDLTTNTANAGTTGTLTINATGLTTGRLLFNGAAETDGGVYVVNAGSSVTDSTGADTLIGGSGNDVFYAGNGANVFTGNAGADSITGGTGVDTVYADNAGTKQVSTFTVAAAGDGQVLAGDIFTVTIAGFTSSYTMTIANVAGNAAADVLAASTGLAAAINANTNLTGLIATATNALGVVTVTALVDGVLTTGITEGSADNGVTVATANTTTGTAGTTGADTVVGGAGADLIVGGGGADVLTGDAGIDRFFFLKAHSVLGSIATITDYRAAAGNNAGAADTIVLGDQVAVAGSVATVQDFSSAASLGAALNSAANGNATNVGLVVFMYGGDTYALVETTGGNTTYTAGDFLIKITGTPFTTATALAGLGFDGV